MSRVLPWLQEGRYGFRRGAVHDRLDRSGPLPRRGGGAAGLGGVGGVPGHRERFQQPSLGEDRGGLGAAWRAPLSAVSSRRGDRRCLPATAWVSPLDIGEPTYPKPGETVGPSPLTRIPKVLQGGPPGGPPGVQ
jgi:hypothetical protein